MSDDAYTRITLRIPNQLHQRLTEAAANNSHSMNAEIVARLDNSFGSLEDRMRKLELVVFDEERGNEALLHRTMANEDEYKEIASDIMRKVRDRY